MNNSLNTVALLGALLAASAAHTATAHVGFENKAGVDLRVEILYSTADATSYGKRDVQKTRNIATLNRREFEFGSNDTNCGTKTRNFAVYAAPDGVKQELILHGGFSFKGEKVVTSDGANSKTVCTLNLKTLTSTPVDGAYRIEWNEKALGDPRVEIVVYGTLEKLPTTPK